MSNKSDKESEPKGFAGFDSLVSNVDKDIAEAKRAATHVPTPESKANTQERPQASPPEASAEPASWQSGAKPSGDSGKVWWWVAGVALFFFWVIGNQDNKKSAGSAPDTSTAQPLAPSASGTAAASILDGLISPNASDWNEEKPPTGVDRVLGYAQIRYCVAEDIRLKTMEGLINQYADVEVDGFNAYVSDYNSRCGKYRYRSGSLESVQRAAAGHRSMFEAEGRQRVAYWRSQGSRSQSDSPVASSYSSNKAATTQPRQAARPQSAYSTLPTSVAPEVFEQQPVKSRAVELSSDEKSAVELACIVAKSDGPAAYNRCVAGQLRDLEGGPRTPSLAALSYDEKSAIELACITTKSDGPAPYNRCLVRQLQALSNAPREPSLAGLTYDEKSAVELACITTKSDGAADYNRCLVAQLRELQGAPRQPDMSGLSYDEKFAIELACITTKSDGPASYNRCLAGQLRELQGAPRTPSLAGLTYQQKSSIELTCITEKSDGAAAYNRCLTRQLASIGR